MTQQFLHFGSQPVYSRLNVIVKFGGRTVALTAKYFTHKHKRLFSDQLLSLFVNISDLITEVI